jgi:hypothetical protein
MRSRILLVPVLLVAALVFAPQALASQLVTRNATHVSIKVDKYNRALVSYYQAGAWHHTLWWGALNAKYPDHAAPQSQYRFHMDYSGGSGSFGAGYWMHMVNVCGPYKGPHLWHMVAGCTMNAWPHTNWALQSWQRLMPNGGWPCCRGPGQGAWELHVSHFSGPGYLAHIWLKWNWTRAIYSGFRLDQLYGRITWLGRGYYGWTSNRYGDPTDSFGELIYVDAWDSRWGAGYKRINSFLSHYLSDGSFCDQNWPNRYGRVNSPGNGTAYRAVADGPGVTPIVAWSGPPPGNYSRSRGLTRDLLGIFTMNVGGARKAFNASLQAAFANEQLHLFSAGDKCHSNW